MIKIDEKVLKKIGWIRPKKMFSAVSFAYMLSQERGLSIFKAIQISGGYYEIDKGVLTSWMIKLKDAMETVSINLPPVPSAASKEMSAECAGWEQKMTELEAVVIG